MSLTLNNNITENKNFTFIKIISVNIDIISNSLVVLYKRGWMDGNDEVLDDKIKHVSKDGTDFISYMTEVADIYNSVKQSLYSLISNETGIMGTIK